MHGTYNFLMYGIFFSTLVKKGHSDKDLEAFFDASV